jgi:hypothetical protein
VQLGSHAKLVIFTAYALILLIRACRRRPGFATWHMFARFHACHFDLHQTDSEGNREQFNPWRYLPHSHTKMSAVELPYFLAYLERVRGLQLSGTVECLDGARRRLIHIEHTRVVD